VNVSAKIIGRKAVAAVDFAFRLFQGGELRRIQRIQAEPPGQQAAFQRFALRRGQAFNRVFDFANCTIRIVNGSSLLQQTFLTEP
jgi:hypothetical protein